MKVAGHKFCAAAIVFLAMVAPAAVRAGDAQGAAHRVVSLNPCLDAILLRVAAPEQIAALSHYARDPSGSTIADEAADFPVVHDSAEEVIMLNPNLVIAGFHNDPATRNALRRLGIRTEIFKVPQSIGESIAQVKAIADLVGRAPMGERLVAEIEAALARVTPPAGSRRYRALIFQATGLTPGATTLADELLRLAGFENAAYDYGPGKWHTVSLEYLIAAPPEILLSGNMSAQHSALLGRLMRHPAIRNLEGQLVRADFPERLLYCGGPALTVSAAALGRARRLAEAALP